MMQNMNALQSRQKRWKPPNQTKTTCGTKINLLVLDDVEHELVVEQADEMEAAKAGGAAQGQVTDDHARVERPPEIADICVHQTVSL